MHGKNELYNIFHHSIALIAHKFKVYQFNYNYKIRLISKLTLFVFLFNNSDTWTFLRFISNLVQSLIFGKSGVILLKPR